MKRYTAAVALLLATAAFCVNGCILDAFNEITQNITIERSFTVAGNTNNVVTQTGQFSLNDSQLYLDNKDKIKKMQYKAAAFCVTANDVPALQGTIVLTLRSGGPTGPLLFTKTLSNFRANDYLGVKARNLDLTSAEIDAINAQLSDVSLLGSKIFSAGLQVQNATPTNTTVNFKSFISLALEMTIEP